MKLYLYPEFAGEDQGDGGIRRVVEAQRKYLPELGVEVVDQPADADLIACHISVPSTFWSNYRDKPIIVHNHGLYWDEYAWPNWALKTNEQCLESIRLADAVTAPSEWVAQVLRRHTMRRVTSLVHGVDLAEWQALKNQGYVFWNKTRQDPICDSSVVDEVAQRMLETRFVTTFGKEASNVLVTGKLPYEQGKDLLQHADVYLCTSRETFGIGTLEAMACGVPVVGWAWGGQREIVEHGRTGWLVAPGDFDGLVEGIKWAVENRRKISRLVRAAVEERYQWQNIIPQYVQLYEEVLSRHQIVRPKVSVIVTAYNLEAYLPECLDSVLAQTLQDWECIIVDDASPDHCGQIADRYAKKDSRVRVIHNESNQYLSAARNTGIASSQGKYILPLDADDMLAPQALQLLSQALDDDRTTHIAYGGVEFLELDGRRWHSGWPMPFRFEWQLQQKNLLPYCSMYRREVWEDTGGYRTRCRTAEDADFWARTCSYGYRPTMVTTADTLIYRNRPDSMSRVQAPTDWAEWFPWSSHPEIAPAGAVSIKQLPVSSLEPTEVAVVIPVGPGHEKYLMDAVDSVDGQTFRRWECIVVNDTGHPLLLLPSWVKVVETGQATPVGVAKARNLGIESADSPLFVPLDADDYLQPTALSLMWTVWQEVGGVVYSDWWEVFDDGELQLYKPPEYDAALLKQKGCIHAVTALYPRSAWREVGGFDASVAWEDWDFQIALANIGVCGSRIPEPLWVYRKTTGLRREEAQRNFDESKSTVLAKWGELWEGRLELMGCRACPGGGGRILQATPPAEGRLPIPGNDDVVVIRYTGSSRGSRAFRGPKSGRVYFFDATPSGHTKYVLRQDAEFFRGMLDFEILLLPEGSGQPDLVVVGPPGV